MKPAHLAPPPPSTRAMLFPVRTRASREKSLCLSGVFSNTFSYKSLCVITGNRKHLRHNIPCLSTNKTLRFLLIWLGCVWKKLCGGIWGEGALSTSCACSATRLSWMDLVHPLYEEGSTFLEPGQQCSPASVPTGGREKRNPHNPKDCVGPGGGFSFVFNMGILLRG